MMSRRGQILDSPETEEWEEFIEVATLIDPGGSSYKRNAYIHRAHTKLTKFD